MITWKNIAAFDPGSLIKATSEATDKFTEKISDITAKADPTERQAAAVEREGELELRDVISGKGTTGDLKTLRAAEAGYDPNVLAATTFMNKEQAATAGDYFQTKIGAERDRVTSEALKIGGEIADKERDIGSGIDAMRSFLQEQGMGEELIESTLGKLDASGKRQTDYNKANTDAAFDYVGAQPITADMSNAQIDKLAAAYTGPNRLEVRNEMTRRRENVRTDQKYTSEQLVEDTVNEAVQGYHTNADRAAAVQQISNSGLSGKYKREALDNFNKHADTVEKLTDVEKIELQEVAGQAQSEVDAQMQLGQDHVNRQQVAYDTRIDAPAKEIAAEADRFDKSGVGVIELLTKPTQHAGLIKRFFNVDVQFHDAAASALADQYNKMVAKGIPENTAAVFLKKSVAKNFDANQAIGSGSGVDPRALNKTINDYTQNYLDAEQDREALETNKEALVALKRQLNDRKRTFTNAYATDLYQQKATTRGSRLPEIMKQYQDSAVSFIPPISEAAKAIKGSIKPEPDSDAAETTTRSRKEYKTWKEKQAEKKAEKERAGALREKRTQEKLAKAAKDAAKREQVASR